MGQNIIKSIVRSECPHCKKPLFIPFSFTPPLMSRILSEEDVQAAKAAAREAINNSALPDQEKNDAIKSINGKDVVFGMEDLKTVTDSFITQ